MINVGMNQASAVMRAPYGVFQSSLEARAVMEALMREVIALAEGAGHEEFKHRMQSIFVYGYNAKYQSFQQFEELLGDLRGAEDDSGLP